MRGEDDKRGDGRTTRTPPGTRERRRWENSEDQGTARGKRCRGGYKDEGRVRGGGDDDDNVTHHPAPASRATARGVGRGWNDDDTHDSTLDHRHEPLLMGWKGVLVRYGVRDF